MPIIRLVWTDLDHRTERSRTFKAASVAAAFHVAEEIPAEVSIELWVDGKFRAWLERVLHESGWYWRIG